VTARGVRIIRVDSSARSRLAPRRFGRALAHGCRAAPNLIDTVADVPANNVKIITNGAKVVLRGPVKSAQERASIEAKARATAGVTDVDNQLEVKP
jgi:BON domain